MPFAKRSTYTLSLAISAILASGYSLAAPDAKDMAWNCNMSQNGEWDCDINEEAIKKAEAEQSTTESAQTVEPRTDGESVVVEPAPNAAAAALPVVKIEKTTTALPIVEAIKPIKNKASL